MWRLLALLSNLYYRARVERELDEEVNAYLEMLAREKMERGSSPEQAWRDAKLELGGLEPVKERVREIRMGAFLEGLYRDVVIACRSLAKGPGVSAVVLLTLGLAIGANTAIFSVVDQVLLEPLPFPEPDRLVRLWSAYPERGVERGTSSPLDLEDWREANDVFESMGAYPALDLGGFVWTGGGSPEEIQTTFVTDGFFETLAAEAALGRTLVAGDHVRGRDRVVVLSHRNWVRRFGGEPEVIGRTLSLDDEPFVVVGVMPPSFEFPHAQAEMWAPLSLIPDEGVPRRRDVRWLSVLARLKPGVALGEARVEMDAIVRRLHLEYPETNEGLTAVTLRPLHEALVGDVESSILAVFGGVALVLLIGCTNIASLLLSRSERRLREYAVRSALGAGRARLVRQSLVESLVLSLGGAGFAVVLALFVLKGLLAAAPPDIPRLSSVSLDGSVLLFTAIISLVTGAALGLLPALRAVRSEHGDTLKDGARTRFGENRMSWRGVLVVAQVALVVVLSIAAGLLIRSYALVERIDPGLRPENVLTLSVEAPGYKYPESDQIVSFFDDVLREVAAVPGVTAAALVRPLPLRADTFAGENFSFRIVGEEDPAPGDEPRAALRFVSPGYLRTMGIPLLSGRDFTDRDDRSGPVVLVANQAAADRYWAGEDPVGQQIAAGGAAATIIGVVGNVRQLGLDAEPGPTFCGSFRQTTRRGMALVARVKGPPLSVLGSVEKAIRRVNPDQPINDIAPMGQILFDSLSQRRFSTSLLGLFAALALALAAVGIYGVMSYSVSRRRHEIGLRMALGASTGDILRAVLMRALGMAGLGLAIGLLVSVLATGWLRSLLFQIEARDPWTFVGVSLLLGGIALAASLLPALAAVRVEPTAALRHE